MLQQELIDGLEARPNLDGLRCFVGLARKGLALPYAVVLEKSMPQFGSTLGGSHPVHQHSGFTISVYAETQLRAKELAGLARDWLADCTGKLFASGSRVVEASDSPESPQDGIVMEEGQPPSFLTSFDIHFIHKAE